MLIDKKALGRRIKSGMTDKGWNVSQFSEETGIPESTLGTWMRGEAMPQFDGLCAVADALGWSLDRFADESIKKAS